jgi:hypothetical protein
MAKEYKVEEKLLDEAREELATNAKKELAKAQVMISFYNQMAADEFGKEKASEPLLKADELKKKVVDFNTKFLLFLGK